MKAKIVLILIVFVSAFPSLVCEALGWAENLILVIDLQ